MGGVKLGLVGRIIAGVLAFLCGTYLMTLYDQPRERAILIEKGVYQGAPDSALESGRLDSLRGRAGQQSGQ